MLTPIQPPRNIDFLAVFILGILWASSFGVIKFLLDNFSPLAISALRTGIGGLMLLPFMLGKTLPINHKDWLFVLAVAFFGNALPFTLIPIGEMEVDSGLAGMLMALGPIFALFISHFTTPDDKITKRKFLGMCLGFSGALLIFGNSILSGQISQIPYILMIILALVSYVTSGIFIRHLGHIHIIVITCLSLLIATLMTIPFSLLIGDPISDTVSDKAILAMVYLGAIPTGLAFLLRFMIVHRAGYTFFSYVGYIVPAFSLILGAVFFLEAITPDKVVALVCILGGLVLLRK